MSELRPFRRGGLDAHFWLTRSMARMTGVNLREAMANGSTDGDGYAELVAKCRLCSHTKDCVNWLATQAGAADTAPDFCLIGEPLTALQT